MAERHDRVALGRQGWVAPGQGPRASILCRTFAQPRGAISMQYYGGTRGFLSQESRAPPFTGSHLRQAQ
jgi:hypothetical protein